METGHPNFFSRLWFRSLFVSLIVIFILCLDEDSTLSAGPSPQEQKINIRSLIDHSTHGKLQRGDFLPPKFNENTDFNGSRFVSLSNDKSHYTFESKLFADNYVLLRLPPIDTSPIQIGGPDYIGFSEKRMFLGVDGSGSPDFLHEVKSLNDLKGFVSIGDETDAIEYVRLGSSTVTNQFFEPRMHELFCVSEQFVGDYAVFATPEECQTLGIGHPIVEAKASAEEFVVNVNVKGDLSQQQAISVDSLRSSFEKNKERTKDIFIKSNGKTVSTEIKGTLSSEEIGYLNDLINTVRAGQRTIQIGITMERRCGDKGFLVTRTVVKSSEGLYGIYKVTEEVRGDGKWILKAKHLVQRFSTETAKFFGARRPIRLSPAELFNSSFEIDGNTDGFPDGWQIDGHIRAGLQGLVVQDGAKAVKIVGVEDPHGASSGRFFIEQPLSNFPGNKAYKVSGYTRPDHGWSDVRFTVLKRSLDGTLESVGDFNISELSLFKDFLRGNGGDFFNFEATTLVLPVGTQSLQIVFFVDAIAGNKKSAIFIDNLKLQQVEDFSQ